jgi:hypothetical protein
MRSCDAFHEAMQAQASKVVGHHALGDIGGRNAKQLGNMLTQVTIAEAARKQAKESQRHEQRQNAWVAEAKGGCPLLTLYDRAMDLVEFVLSDEAVMADALNVQKTSVGRKTDPP